ncbi:MAG TPA: ABC transporter substrate-binding protein [Symbiobacteriaceae bacterium]
MGRSADSRKGLVTVAAVVLMALLAGCGGTRSFDNSPDQSAEGAILIGVSGPLTGDNAEYGKIWKQGFDLALKEINGNGGIHGRPLQYVFQDTQSDPKQTPAVAQRFVANPQIVAVMGDFSSPASMAASPIYQRAGLLQLGITNSHPDFTKTGDYIWSNSVSQADEAPALAALTVERLGKKRLAVLHMNTDWGKTTADLLVQSAREKGAEVLLQEGYLLTEKDFRPVLTKVRDAAPDALVLISYYNDGALIVQQLDAVALTVPVVAVSSVYSPQFINLGGKAVEGIYTITRFHPDDPRPEVRAFVKAYREAYGTDPDTFAAAAYDGMKIIAQALAAGGVDRKAVRDALASGLEVETVLYGRSRFGPDRRLQNPRFVALVVRNGRFELLAP